MAHFSHGMVHVMVEDDNETEWWNGTVLTRISPRDVMETVIIGVLWPPTYLILRAGNWIVERVRK